MPAIPGCSVRVVQRPCEVACNRVISEPLVVQVTLPADWHVRYVYGVAVLRDVVDDIPGPVIEGLSIVHCGTTYQRIRDSTLVARPTDDDNATIGGNKIVKEDGDTVPLVKMDRKFVLSFRDMRINYTPAVVCFLVHVKAVMVAEQLPLVVGAVSDIQSVRVMEEDE